MFHALHGAYSYLQFIAVLEFHSLEVLLPHYLHDGVLELFLEGEVLAARVELIHEGLVSAGERSNKERTNQHAASSDV